MEIRLLYGNEIQWAVQTAHEVYEQCVRPYTRNAAEVQQYYDYMNLPNLSQEMLAGRRFYGAHLKRADVRRQCHAECRTYHGAVCKTAVF